MPSGQALVTKGSRDYNSGRALFSNLSSVFGVGGLDKVCQWRPSDALQIRMLGRWQVPKTTKKCQVLEIGWCCSTCSGYSFFCFMEAWKLGRLFFVDGRVGVWTVKGMHECYWDEGKAKVRHWTKGEGEWESSGCIFLLRNCAERFILLLLLWCGTCGEEGRHVWLIEGSGWLGCVFHKYFFPYR